MSIFRPVLLSGIAAFALTACGGDEEAPQATPTAKTEAAMRDTTKNDNKMVVLPAGARMAAAVVYPPALQDGSYGSTEVQTAAALAGLRNLLKKENLTLGNVTRLRVTLVAGPSGQPDYVGFRNAYGKYFGTKLLPSEPVMTVVQVQSLPKTGPLVQIEADIAIAKPVAPKPSE